MDINELNRDLSLLLQSENGCEYSDVLDGVFEDLAGKNFNLNVLHLNIRSLQKNKDNLLILLSDLRDKGIVVHLLGICETYLDQNLSTCILLENYKGFHKTRTNRQGGGTSIFVHDSVEVVTELEVPFNSNLESIALCLNYKGDELVFCEFYRPPNSSSIIVFKL